MDIGLRILAAILGVVCLMALALEGPWWLEYARHFMVQLTVCCGVGSLVFAFRRSKVWALILLSLGVWQATVMWSALDGPEHVEPLGGDLKLLSVNVLTSNQNPQPLLDLIAEERPDLLVLLEVNQMWLDMLRSLHEKFPYRAEQARGDNFGIALWSRIPMEAKTEWIGPVEIPSIRAHFGEVEVPFTLFAIHPLPPMNKRMVLSRNRQLTAVAEQINRVSHPVLVAGDANATPWSHALLDFRSQAGLRPARTSLTATWPTYFAPMGIQIDHVLATTGIEVVSCERGPDVGSDHWPLLTRFRSAQVLPRDNDRPLPAMH